jgi:hypothetical protein
MAAKSIASAAGDIAGSSTTWSAHSANWNGFAIDMVNQLGKSMRFMSPSNPFLTTSPDGRFAYALSTWGNDVSIINMLDGAVIRQIGLGTDGLGVTRSEDGPVICAWGRKKVNWIDTSTNELRSTERPCHGHFVRVQLEPEQRWIVLYSDRCATFWDTKTGVRVAAIEDLGKPRLVFSSAGILAR